MERPTFSPFWHRVRSLRPRLRPHVEITRQHYRGRRWHVAHDPASNNFYRLNPVAHDFVSSLDGRRTVEEAWKLCLAKHSDDAPTQNEVVELLGQLHSSNLLSIDTTPETEQLLRRSGERRGKKVKQQLVGLMYFRIKLFNPDPILRVLLPFFRPLLNRAGLIAWCVLVAAALATLAPRWGELSASVYKVTNPAAWPWIMAVFILLKLWHEMGHGLICRRHGGAVPEFGVMMLVLFPAPYVDASSCWAFPSKYQRMAVGAGGMIFELAAAAVAAFVWAATPEGSVSRDVAFYVMLTAGVSTVLFNANPLMRFDGYYILADLIEVPNLMPRSAAMLKYLFKRHAYRLKNIRPPTTSPAEAGTLVVYGALSLAYRTFLFLAITLWLLGFFFGIGLILALWTAIAWFVLPTGAFAHWLASSSELIDRRGRAILTSLALVAGTLLLVGVVPLPDYRRGEGVVESLAETGIFIQTDGFVAQAHKRPGDAVRAGEPILTLEGPELDAARRGAVAQVAAARARLAEAHAGNDAATALSAERELGYWQRSLEDVDRRLELLVVKAPWEGVVVGQDPARLIGAYVTRGRTVCGIVDPSRLRIAAMLSQGEATWMFELKPEELTAAARPVGEPGRIIHATAIRPIPAAQRRLAHAALGFGGGGTIETSPADQTGSTARREQFQVYLEADAKDLARTSPGERVIVRFELPSKSILHQIVDRIHRTIQGRIDL